jgi:hypothetical protein
VTFQGSPAILPFKIDASRIQVNKDSRFKDAASEVRNPFGVTESNKFESIAALLADHGTPL